MCSLYQSAKRLVRWKRGSEVRLGQYLHIGRSSPVGCRSQSSAATCANAPYWPAQGVSSHGHCGSIPSPPRSRYACAYPFNGAPACSLRCFRWEERPQRAPRNGLRNRARGFGSTDPTSRWPRDKQLVTCLVRVCKWEQTA